MAIHTRLGPGLLESVYETSLAYDLAQIGLNVKRQVAVPFVYKDVRMEVGFRIDILVDDIVLLEIKSIEALAPVHFAQTLTYLRLANLKLGMLINFNVKSLSEGVHRVVNKL